MEYLRFKTMQDKSQNFLVSLEERRSSTENILSFFNYMINKLHENKNLAIFRFI